MKIATFNPMTAAITFTAPLGWQPKATATATPIANTPRATPAPIAAFGRWIWLPAQMAPWTAKPRTASTKNAILPLPMKGSPLPSAARTANPARARPGTKAIIVLHSFRAGLARASLTV